MFKFGKQGNKQDVHRLKKHVEKNPTMSVIGWSLLSGLPINF